MTREDIVERRGRLEDHDRSFDLSFWQAQTQEARFSAAWELIFHAYQIKGIDVRQSRLQRSAEKYGQQKDLDRS